jgi:hypothetical protein
MLYTLGKQCLLQLHCTQTSYSNLALAKTSLQIAIGRSIAAAGALGLLQALNGTYMEIVTIKLGHGKFFSA